MFSQNRKRSISVELRGCFHDTEEKNQNTNGLFSLAPLTDEKFS